MARTGRPLAMPAEERKKEIYVAVEQLLTERAYEKVTMSEIAAKAGMSKKTLYVYFADKNELMESLVASSYVWPQKAQEDASPDPVHALRLRLHGIAEHVLCEHHLRLCRLAIGERVGHTRIADMFYEMGISASRGSLILAVERIEPSRWNLKIKSLLLVEMIFGASIGYHLMDALLTGRLPDKQLIQDAIDEVIESLFSSAQPPATR
ncbi:TetR/AcrR family transcriptional regulator [Pseudomonas sp. PB120]|uniref:TetR/AcrR family transcriptional regulator n=1 Tax=Pseudomonas sp. PB120 TaxID=2494700 RepID=UPI0012FD0702|nr:TetR/AcrR family transcriptional regulator [Pseudomonas sp. PB120]MVV51790.1 TetR/AcrR family transcriptional regulator [Pseudomonas sp. PB120]